MGRILFICFLLATYSGLAQTTVSGIVKDNKSRPIPGASISIRDSYDGATADSLGAFHFTTTEKGRQVIEVTAVGFTPLEMEREMNGSELVLNIVLKELASELNAVVITAGAFEASDTKRATVLTSLDIATTASANADVTSALKTLPGAQQVGESEGLFVRGGTATETKVFIDGTLVNNFFLSSVPDLAQRGRFSPFLFKGTVFSSGGYSALYGQALSAAVILESVDLPDRTSATAGVSTVGINAGYQHLAANKKSSWGVSYNFTHLGAYFSLVAQRPDHFRIPVFHNGDVNFRIKTSKTGILKFYSYFNFSNLGIRRPDIDSFQLKNAFSMYNGNVYANLSYKEKIASNTRLNIGIAYSNNLDRIRQELQDLENQTVNLEQEPYRSKAFRLDSRAHMISVKPVVERRFGALSAIRAGMEYIAFRNNNEFSSQVVQGAALTANDDFLAGFAESDIYLTNEFAAKTGARFEHSSLLGRSNIAPRISLAYRLGLKGQASLAYGLFYQQPEKEYYLRGLQIPSASYQKATHYILNYQWLSTNHTFRAELFNKNYDGLMKTNFADDISLPDTLFNRGGGYARGIELFWRDKKSLKGVDYWVSYSFLDSKRNYLNYPFEMEPTFMAKHTFSVVVKKFFTPLKTQFNASYTFASGRPYYNIVRAGNKSMIGDQGRTIPYQDLSISINYLPFLAKQTAKSFTVFVFSINNVLGLNQVYGYNYSFDGKNKQPILPAARQFFFLGCFLSFGIDRTQEIINNNL